ncbi:hypothetical protein [Gloeothece verrucosa]|uniref:Uncharacterized protein n=1 Tax=Gloeothece verrucosa (strain PCC 7822) TaxID=497965 RepID=E0UMP0_GLOV7|nr:hypothetical protein [Gloeothece verrucosa]ADN18220.1 conserved hypothetical protein [Gloeothece verrucosa PCC 7822]
MTSTVKTPNDDQSIRVSRVLDKPTSLWIIPGEFIVPWLAIFSTTLMGYWIVNQFHPISPYWLMFACPSLTTSHWILFGKEPWKFGGRFHLASHWVLGHPNAAAPGQNLFKPKVGNKKVGLGSNRRTVKAFEDQLDLGCLIEIRGRSSVPVGGYWLQKGKKNQIIWVFDCWGFSSSLPSEMIEEIIFKLREGLKDIFEEERITIRALSRANDEIRQAYLSSLKTKTTNKGVKFLLHHLQLRVRELVLKGKHNPKSLRIEISYSFNKEDLVASDNLEKWLVRMQKISESLSGSAPITERAEVGSLLAKAYEEGYILYIEYLRVKLGLYVRPLSAKEIFIEDWCRFNRLKEQSFIPAIPQLIILEGDRLSWEINDPDTHITTCLFGANSPIADKQWVYLPGRGQYVGGCVFAAKPGGWKTFLDQLVWGSSFLNTPNIFDAEIVVQVSRPSQERLQFVAQQRTKDSNSSLQYSSKRSRINVGANYNIQQNIEAEETFLGGGVGVRVAWVALIYRPDLQLLNRAITRFCALFRQPAIVEREREYFDEIWLETLPYTLKWLLHKPYERRKIYWNHETVPILPLSFDLTPTQKGVSLIAHKGSTPIYIDPFSRPSHTAIFGTTGTGKSLIAGEFITLALANGMETTIIDSTRGDGSGTFDFYTEFLGGAYYNSVTESNNIFEGADLRFFRDPEEKTAKETIIRDFLLTSLMTLTLDADSPRDKRRNYRTTLTIALAKFFEDPAIINRYHAAYDAGIGTSPWQDIPTLKDFLPFLSLDRLIEGEGSFNLEETLAQIRWELNSVLNSSVGNAIARPSTFKGDAPLVVYGIGGVEDDFTMLVHALSAYSAAILRSLRCDKSFLFMDESSYLAGNFNIFAQILGSLCAKARKSGISIAYSGQDLNSILKTDNASQILDNTQNYLIGKVVDKAVETFASELNIPREILRKYATDGLEAEMLWGGREDFSSPWIVKTRIGLIEASYYPSYEQVAALENQKELIGRRKYYKGTCSSPYEVLTRFTRDLKHYKRHGEFPPINQVAA